jgi:hypothetical protein
VRVPTTPFEVGPGREIDPARFCACASKVPPRTPMRQPNRQWSPGLLGDRACQGRHSPGSEARKGAAMSALALPRRLAET